MNKCTKNSCCCMQCERVRRDLFLYTNRSFCHDKDNNKNGKHFYLYLIPPISLLSSGNAIKIPKIYLFISEIWVLKQPSWSLWLCFVFLCRTNDNSEKVLQSRMRGGKSFWGWTGCLVTRTMIIGKENIKWDDFGWKWMQTTRHNISEHNHLVCLQWNESHLDGEQRRDLKRKLHNPGQAYHQVCSTQKRNTPVQF